MARRDANWLLALDGRDGVWSIEAWCRQFGCTAPYFHALDPAPHRVRVGRLVRITESPRDYLERVRRLREAGGIAEAA